MAQPIPPSLSESLPDPPTPRRPPPWRWFLRGLVNLGMCALLLVVLSSVVGWLRAPDLEGPAPALTLLDTDGQRVSLASFRGKTVVLNFWATWCGPCRIEIPMINAFANAHHDDVVVLGVAVDGSAIHLKNAKDELGIDYPVLVGNAAVASAWEAKVLPTTVVIDPKGHFKYAHVGVITHPQLELAVW